MKGQFENKWIHMNDGGGGGGGGVETWQARLRLFIMGVFRVKCYQRGTQAVQGIPRQSVFITPPRRSALSGSVLNGCVCSIWKHVWLGTCDVPPIITLNWQAPNKYETLIHGWFNVGPASQTLNQPWVNASCWLALARVLRHGLTSLSCLLGRPCVVS